MTHPLSIQPPGWDSPPEPSKEYLRDDFIENAKKYLNTKEDHKLCQEQLKEFEQEMKNLAQYLFAEHEVEESDIEKILNHIL